MKRHRFLSLLAASAMLLSALPQMQLSAFAEDTTPAKFELGKLDPPQLVSVYDSAYLEHDRNTSMTLNSINSLSFLEFGDQWKQQDPDNCPYRYADAYFQIDYKLDDGDWHYQKAWDTNPYGDYDNYRDGFDSDYGFTNDFLVRKTLFEGSQYARVLADEECNIIEKDIVLSFKKYTNGEDDFYIFDTENHQLAFRARYYITMREKETDETIYLYSDWSDACLYGKGEGEETDVYPAGDGDYMLPAPKLTEAAVTELHGYADAPTVTFTLLPDTGFLPLQFDSYDPHASDTNLALEMSLNGKDWYPRDNYSFRNYHFNADFYDFWKQMEGNDGTFSWETAEVQFRAKYKMNIWGSNAAGDYVDYYLESPYSDPISVEIPGMEAYDINISHVGAGWDGGGTASKRLVADTEIDCIWVDPKEGCYVETVTINGKTFYDRNDETTYGLLGWSWLWSDTFNPDTISDFKLEGDVGIVSEDLDIVITYGGEATKLYKVTFIQHGPFSDEDRAYGIDMSNADSWSGGNTLLLYDGTESVLTLNPVDHCSVKQLFIDGDDVTDNLVYEEDAVRYTYDMGIIDRDIDVVVFYERYGVTWRTTSQGDGKFYSDDYTKQQGIMGLLPGDRVSTYFELQQIHEDQYGNPLEDTWTELLSLSVLLRIGNESDTTVIESYSKTENADIFAEIRKNQSYTFVVPDDIDLNSELIFFAEFSKIDDPIIKQYEIDVTRGEGAYHAAHETVMVDEKTNSTIFLAPETGYEIDTVTVDGAVIEDFGGTSYVFTNVTENHTIAVTYKKIEAVKTYKVSVSVKQPDKAENVITPTGSSLVEENQPFILTITPAENCKLKSITANGAPISVQPNELGQISFDITEDTDIVVTMETIMLNIEYVDWNNNLLYKATIPYGTSCQYEGETDLLSLNGWNDQNQYVRFNGWSEDSATLFKKDTKIIANQQVLSFIIVPPSRVTYDTKSGNVDTTDLELQVTQTDITYTEKISTVDGKKVSELVPTSKTENKKYTINNACCIEPKTLDEAFKTADTCDVKVFYSVSGMPDLAVGSFRITYSNGFQLGDVDRDGVISERDAILVLREYASVVVLGNDSILDTQQKPLADINGDGNIDTLDAVLILRYYSAYSLLGKTDITWEELING